MGLSSYGRSWYTAERDGSRCDSGRSANSSRIVSRSSVAGRNLPPNPLEPFLSAWELGHGQGHTYCARQGLAQNLGEVHHLSELVWVLGDHCLNRLSLKPVVFQASYASPC